MRLFSSDLVRNFSIGFLLGALLVAGANAERLSEQIASPALAAPMVETPQPTAEFVIAPAQHGE
ncbi:hypothetical protein [Erythrobacter tepidarius]|uniref:hypothetical protein n=1 Tax=Erythrobacter tepidarius TaxID=60454 RepID=UPI000A37F42F|nr:hypothetical protein [Erythrobacter tepidarius]